MILLDTHQYHWIILQNLNRRYDKNQYFRNILINNKTVKSEKSTELCSENNVQNYAVCIYLLFSSLKCL